MKQEQLSSLILHKEIKDLGDFKELIKIKVTRTTVLYINPLQFVKDNSFYKIKINIYLNGYIDHTDARRFKVRKRIEELFPLVKIDCHFHDVDEIGNYENINYVKKSNKLNIFGFTPIMFHSFTIDQVLDNCIEDDEQFIQFIEDLNNGSSKYGNKFYILHLQQYDAYVVMPRNKLYRDDRVILKVIVPPEFKGSAIGVGGVNINNLIETMKSELDFLANKTIIIKIRGFRDV